MPLHDPLKTWERNVRVSRPLSSTADAALHGNNEMRRRRKPNSNRDTQMGHASSDWSGDLHNTSDEVEFELGAHRGRRRHPTAVAPTCSVPPPRESLAVDAQRSFFSAVMSGDSASDAKPTTQSLRGELPVVTTVSPTSHSAAQQTHHDNIAAHRRSRGLPGYTTIGDKRGVPPVTARHVIGSSADETFGGRFLHVQDAPRVRPVPPELPTPQKQRQATISRGRRHATTPQQPYLSSSTSGNTSTDGGTGAPTSAGERVRVLDSPSATESTLASVLGAAGANGRRGGRTVGKRSRDFRENDDGHVDDFEFISAAERLQRLSGSISQQPASVLAKNIVSLPETEEPGTWKQVLEDRTADIPVRTPAEVESLHQALKSLNFDGADSWTYARDLSLHNPEQCATLRRQHGSGSSLSSSTLQGGVHRDSNTELNDASGDENSYVPRAISTMTDLDTHRIRMAERRRRAHQAKAAGIKQCLTTTDSALAAATALVDNANHDAEMATAHALPCQFFFEEEAAEIAATLQTARDRDLRMRRLVPMYDVVTQRAQGEASAVASQRKGLYYFDRCDELADMFDFKRSPDQQRFHSAIFQTCAPHIVGRENYLAVRDQLLTRAGREEPNMGALIMCPRRWGKTTATAMAMAVIMYVCRGVNILVFSTGQAMSTTFMQMVSKFFMQLPTAGERIIIDNSREFGVSHMGTPSGVNRHHIKASGRYNILKARAANVTHNRGVTADIFVLEEAAAIPAQVLRTVIAPMLKVDQAVLVALSTHQGKENYYTKLLKSEDPMMERLFIRMSVELMCDACKEAGKTPSDCTHREHLHPPWLVSGNKERVKVLMGDDENLYAQEVLGVIWADTNNVFDELWVLDLVKRPRSLLPTDPGLFVMTFIDPGGGVSRTGICSVLRSATGIVHIVGLDEINCTEGPALNNGIASYFSHFNEHAQLSTLRHFLAIEHNYGGPMMADIITRYCKRACPGILEHRSIPNRAGVTTTHDNKASSVVSAMWDLNQNRIHFAPRLASFAYRPDNERNTANEESVVIDQFEEQLKALHKEAIGSSGKWKYTAKTVHGGRDDMLISWLFAMHYSLVIVAMARAHAMASDNGGVVPL
jgi:hypothetical protein